MKTVSIRELHARTGQYVREAARAGGICITDRGRTVARLVPEQDASETPYFARRQFTPAFRKLMSSGVLRGGTDSTQAISEAREDAGA